MHMYGADYLANRFFFIVWYYKTWGSDVTFPPPERRRASEDRQGSLSSLFCSTIFLYGSFYGIGYQQLWLGIVFAIVRHG